ncbi:MAG: TonB-dependent receptor [Cyclobacteriaceae bacterium]|nr:TonB-dependent receptor [Cyclobacteriaceae bacterium]
MKNIIYFMLLLVSAQQGFAQIRVTGRVTDQETENPLPGASIQAPELGKGSISDADGFFSLSLPEGEFELLISFVGFEPERIIVSGAVDLNIRLSSSYKLEEVVIKAIRGEEKIPLTGQILGKREIERNFSGQDPIFLLNKLTPSLVSYSESGTNLTNYGQMRLRGIDQSRINITLDGAPLNDMIDHSVFFSNFTDFSNSIESIQVQRGVGTSTNGTSSFAGSINFQSLDLRNLSPGAELQLMGGSFNTYRASAEVFSGLQDNRFAFYSRFTKTNSDGYRYHTGTDSYSFFFSGAFFYKKDMIKLTGFTGQSRNGLAYSPVAISDIERDPQTNYVNENDVDDFGQDFVQLQYTRSLSGNSSWVSSLYYGAAGGDFPAGFYVTDSIYDPAGTGQYVLEERFTQINYPLFNDHIGLTSYYHFITPDEKLNFNTGIHLYTFQRQNLESVIPGDADPYYDERSRKNELSLFAKAEYRLERWSMLGDVQIRTLDLKINPDDNLLPGEPSVTKTLTFINPKIGISYILDQEKDFYAYYGFSGREPTKVDILGGFQLNPSNISSVKSDDVKPEYVHNFEGGFRLNDGKLKLTINGFLMKFRNEIAPIGAYVPEGFIQLRKNIPSSYRTGLEMDWSWDFLSFFRFDGNATFMKSRIELYDPVEDPNIYQNVIQPLSPDFLGNAGLTYHFRDIFEIEISGNFMSESFLEPTNQDALKMPGFFVSNARFSVNFLKKHSVQLYMNNLFNERYFTYGAPVDPDFDGLTEPGYFVQPPRNFYAMLILKL